MAKKTTIRLSEETVDDLNSIHESFKQFEPGITMNGIVDALISFWYSEGE